MVNANGHTMSSFILHLLLAFLFSAWVGRAAVAGGTIASTIGTTSSSIQFTTTQLVTNCFTWGYPTQTESQWLSGTRVIYGNLFVVCSNESSLVCMLTTQHTYGATLTATEAANTYCNYLPFFKPSLKAKQALRRAGCSSL